MISLLNAMNTPYRLLFSLALLAPGAVTAQVTVVPPPGAPVVEVRPAARLDVEIARRQLATPPQVLVNPAVPAGVEVVPPASGSVTVVTPPPAETTRTTKTTTVVQTPGAPARVYNSERSVVVIQDQGQRRELPYVTLPVLFVKETDQLLDEQSRMALEQMAGIILAITKTEPTSVFDIEGHTSTDGTDDFNMSLSAARATRIFTELTQNYGVPATALSAHGYGETFPMYPNGTEEQMQLDRRVLVVRTR